MKPTALVFFLLVWVLALTSCGGESATSDCPEATDGDIPFVDGDMTDGDDEENEQSASLIVPNGFSFGSVALGNSVRREITLFSGGPGVLEIYEVDLFSETDEIGLEWKGGTIRLHPSEAVTVVLTYEPRDAEGDSAELLISSNAENKLTRLAITSDYKGSANLQSGLESVEFGLVPVGEDAAPVVLRLTNLPGNAEDNKILTINRIHLPETANGAFSLESLPEFPLLLGPNQFVEVTVLFTPLTSGTVLGSLRVENDSDQEPLREKEIPLSGAGGAPSLCISPESMVFAGVRVQQSRNLSLELSNCGQTPLTLSGLRLEGTNAALFELVSAPDLSSPLVLEATEEASVEVRFSPQDASGVKSAVLVVESDDIAFPTRNIALSGYGVQSLLVFESGGEDFSDVEVGNSLARTVTLINQGGAESVVEHLEFVPDGADFGLMDVELPFTLEPEGRVTLDVVFEPQREGAQSASLSARDENGEQSESLLLQGRGIAAHLTLSQETLVDFQTVRVGEQTTRNLTVSNSGLAALRISPPIIEGAAAGYFQVSPSDAMEITSGSPVVLTLTYTPEDSGNDSATLVLESNDMDPARQTFRLPLSGKAIRPTLQVLPSETVDFGSLFILAQSDPQEIRLANIGSGDLLISALEVPEETPGFAVNVPGTIFPVLLRPQATSGDVFRFHVTFSPLTNIPYESILTVVSNAVEADETTIVLSGRGILCPEGMYDCDGNPNDCETPCAGQVSGPELCDGIDNNCNCHVDEGFEQVGSLCDDQGNCCTALGVCGAGVWECDGRDRSRTACSNLSGGSAYAGQAEICDGQDNDCDGVADNPFIRSADGTRKTCEGVGECTDGLLECDPSDPDHLRVRCNTNPGGSLYPTNPPPSEVCDGLDNDCDGLIDEDFFVGAPCTGIGVCQDGTYECSGPNAFRCNTTHPQGSRYEGSAERCDGLDNDCDGLADEGFTVNEATGQPIVCPGIGECDPGLLECETYSTTRCNTLPSGSFYQGTPEICDGLDNDCDGSTDEDYNVGQSCNGVGECGAGVIECKSLNTVRCSTDAGASADQSQPEVCDNKDNDCDGLVDEPYLVGQSCSGVGACPDGVWECRPDGFSARCSTRVGGTQYATYAQEEICDGLDNDCDGQIDELWPVGELCDGVGQCGIGRYECAGSTGYRCSTDPGASQYTYVEERCDNLDHDCDGNPTNGFDLGQPCDSVSTECGSGVTQCSELGNGEMVCSVDFGGSNWEGTPEVQPSSCDGLDNDCDGVTDEPCRSLLYRFTMQLNPVNHDQYLDVSDLPPGGWTMNPSGAFCIIYMLNTGSLVPFYGVNNWLDSAHYYTANLTDYNAKKSLGWDDLGLVGYLSPSDPGDGAVPLVRLYSAALTDYWYSVDALETAVKLSEGYVEDGVIGWVWPTP